MKILPIIVISLSTSFSPLAFADGSDIELGEMKLINEIKSSMQKEFGGNETCSEFHWNNGIKYLHDGNEDSAWLRDILRSIGNANDWKISKEFKKMTGCK